MTVMNPALLPKVRSDAIMRAMRNYPCSLRVSSFYPGYTCSPQNTVVGCHIGTPGKSMGSKSTDLAVAAGCQHCHDILDGRDNLRWGFILDKYSTAFMNRVLQGLIETQQRLVDDGVIVVPDGELI